MSDDALASNEELCRSTGVSDKESSSNLGIKPISSSSSNSNEEISVETVDDEEKEKEELNTEVSLNKEEMSKEECEFDVSSSGSEEEHNATAKQCNKHRSANNYNGCN